MMSVKTSFVPKDARITFDDRYYSDSFDEKRHPRKRTTGTQALVEFLNTTSPEEFQKNSVPKRSSTLFFRRKSTTPTTKPNASPRKPTAAFSSPSPHTIHHKNYIEIIANPFAFKKANKTNSSPSSLSLGTAVHNNSVFGSQLERTLSKSTYHHHHDPVLPLRKGSITQHRRQVPSLRISALVEQKPVNSIFSTSTTFNESEHDIIEGGLKQRLKQYDLDSTQIPSNVISESLAKEHTLALQVVSSMIMDEQQEMCHTTKKKKSRHIQVQTMPVYPNDSITATVQTDPTSPSFMDLTDDNAQLKQRLEKMAAELKQEQLNSSRLQAALEETRDRFEVLSGLAYKKLREVWEEKTRWENACIEVKEKCWRDHQQQIMSRPPSKEDDMSTDFIDGTIMEFMLDEKAEPMQEDEEEEEFLI